MNSYKKSFIEFAISCQALTFGNFTLKSGRKSPYFFNTGLFCTGSTLKQLGMYYANCIIESNIPCDHLFGPAYKGLPLATATAIALQSLYNKDVSVTFNRKEIKDHGEKGQLMGAPLTGNVIIIDDVITAGTAFREASALISQTQAKLRGVVITLDRCEQGQGHLSAIEEIQKQQISVLSIVTFFDLLDYFTLTNQLTIVKQLELYHQSMN